MCAFTAENLCASALGDTRKNSFKLLLFVLTNAHESERELCAAARHASLTKRLSWVAAPAQVHWSQLSLLGMDTATAKTSVRTGLESDQFAISRCVGMAG